MPGEEVGSAYCTISLKDDLASGLSRAKGEFSSAAGEMESLATKLGEAFSLNTGLVGKLGAAVGMSGAAFAVTAIGITATTATFLSCANAAGEYQSALSKIVSVTGQGTAGLEGIEAATRNTTISMQEGSGAALQLSDTFKTNQDIVAALPGVLALAEGGHMSLSQAVQIDSQAVTEFNLKASDTQTASDTFVAGSQHCRESAEQLGEAVGAVGPTAKNLGMSLQETTAVMMVFADTGIKGASAGSQFSIAMKALEKDSKQTDGALAGMGLTFDQIDPKVHSFDEIIQTLSEHHLTLQESMQLFGKAGQAMFAIVQDGGQKFRDYQGEITNTTAATDAAKVASDNYEGATKKLGNAVQALQIAVGNDLIPTLTTVVQTLTSGVHGTEDFGKGVSKAADDAVNWYVKWSAAFLGGDLATQGLTGGKTVGTSTGTGITTGISDSGPGIHSTMGDVLGGPDAQNTGSDAGQKVADAYMKAYGAELEAGYVRINGKLKYSGLQSYEISPEDLPINQAYGIASRKIWNQLTGAKTGASAADVMQALTREGFTDEIKNTVIKTYFGANALANTSALTGALYSNIYSSIAANNGFGVNLGQYNQIPGFTSLQSGTNTNTTDLATLIGISLAQPIAKAAVTPTQLQADEFRKAYDDYVIGLNEFNTASYKDSTERQKAIDDQAIKNDQWNTTQQDFIDKFGLATAKSITMSTAVAGASQILQTKIDTAGNGLLTSGLTTADYLKQAGISYLGSSNIAATALRVGAEAGAKFVTDGGEAVKIGLTASGQEIAVIGQVAQQNFATAGGKFVSDSTAAGQSILGAHQSAATTTTNAASTFQTYINIGAKNVSDVLSKAGDPLVTSAREAAGLLISAGQSFYSAAINQASYVTGLSTAARSTTTTATSIKVSGIDTSGYIDPWMLAGKNVSPANFPTWAKGGIAGTPTLGVFGEAGSEAIVPLDDKAAGWNILKKILPLFGIKTFDTGGIVDTSTAVSDTTTSAIASITVAWDVGKLIQKTETQLTNLKMFFQQTWNIISQQSQQTWFNLNSTIPPLVGQLQTTITNDMVGIRSTTISNWQSLVSGITVQTATIWPAIKSNIILVHDSIINSFSEINTQVAIVMDAMKASMTSSLQGIVDEWGTEFTTITNSVTKMTTEITSLATELTTLISLVNQLNSMGLSLGGSISSGGGGGSISGGSSESGGWLGSMGSTLGENSTGVNIPGDVQDMTCTGPVSINTLKYTSPTGEVTYYNPMTMESLTKTVQAAIATAQASTAQASYGYGLGAGAGVTGGWSSGGYSVPFKSASYATSGYYGSSGNLYGFQEGGIALTPQVAAIAERGGPEMVLPTGITRMFMDLADAGSSINSRSSGMSDDRIVSLLVTALQKSDVYLDGDKLTRKVMSRGIQIAKRQGGWSQ